MKLFVCLMAIAAAQAQQAGSVKLNGGYVLYEEGVAASGQPIASIASLNFSENGSVVGTTIMKTATATTTFDVQGTYSFDSSNTGTLILNGSMIDSDGETQSVTETFNLLSAASGDISAVRSNSGIYSVGEISPLGAAAVRGPYLLTERASNRPYTRLAMLNFDGTGNVNGFEIVQSAGLASKTILKGSYLAQANGFESLSLSTGVTDENGDQQTSAENYVFLPTAREIKMIRTSSGESHLITLSH